MIFRIPEMGDECVGVIGIVQQQHNFCLGLSFLSDVVAL